MKLHFIIYAFLLLSIFSCDAPGTDILYEDTFLEVDAATNVTGEQTFSYLRTNDGQSTPSGFRVTLAAAHQPEAITFNFDIDPSSTAEENVHYQINGNSATIAANNSSTELPIDILDDNINGGESWTIVVNISSSSIPVNPNYQRGTHIIEVFCNSALSENFISNATGTSMDGCCPDPITVDSTVMLVNDGDGKYIVSDWSGGVYKMWYVQNGLPADTDLSIQLTDLCGVISAEFEEPYGNTTTTISGNVDESTGIVTYDWENGLGDFGTVVLTPN